MAKGIHFKIPAPSCNWVEGFFTVGISAHETCVRPPAFQISKGPVKLWRACASHAARAVLLGYKIRKLN
jgi:hypothetical protein